MKKPLITVFTPTYNRAYILPNLYHSLIRQAKNDFEWLIVDDGSTDETESLVKKWMSDELGFSIRYYKKENGGKPRAINFGIQKAEGKYFLMIDSDDYLTDDAIAKFVNWISEIDQEDGYIGVGAARGYSVDRYIKNVPPKIDSKGYVDATNLQRKEYNLDADMTEAYKIDIFKKFPMAEWKNEKFAPEQIALNEMALANYKIRWHKDIVCICEYLEDGLTKGSFKLEKNNPMGYAMMYNHKLKYDISAKEKFYAACQHIALSLYAKHPEYILKSNNMKYTIVAMPIGMILSIRRARQFRKG